MKVIVKNGVYIYKPERIDEFFRVYISGALVKSMKEGAYTPPFYLPVAISATRDAYELWILPLAPFVWVIYLIQSLFYKVWFDMQNLIRMIKVFTK